MQRHVQPYVAFCALPDRCLGSCVHICATVVGGGGEGGSLIWPSLPPVPGVHLGDPTTSPQEYEF